MSSRYSIPAGRVRVEDHIKNSRFIATLGHAPTAARARLFIDTVRDEFSDASHNCWAFVAGPPESLADNGAGDDGEPGGTAGRPMLGILLGSEVGEVVAVVTRYFGGVKLGRGGLVRAYSGAVRHALRELTLAEHVTRVGLQIRLPYAMVSIVERLFEKFDLLIEDKVFTEDATFIVAVEESGLKELKESVRDATAGEARFESVEGK